MPESLLSGSALAAFIAIDVLGVPFPPIVPIVPGAAVVGPIGDGYGPRCSTSVAHGAAAGGAAHPPALIYDATPTPPYAPPSRRPSSA